jgi:protein-disulfide isomerase
MVHKFLMFLAFFFLSHMCTEEAFASKQKQALTKAIDIPEIVVGKETAPITIIEYSSLTCGHCAEFHAQTWPHLKKKYINSGKVKFIFRHFPTDATALKATAILIHVPLPRQLQALNQAFETQASWVETKNFKELGRICGLDAKFCEYITTNSKVLDAIIKKRVMYEEALPIEGTPTFIINGKVYSKYLKLSELEKILNGPASHAK